MVSPAEVQALVQLVEGCALRLVHRDHLLADPLEGKAGRLGGVAATELLHGGRFAMPPSGGALGRKR